MSRIRTIKPGFFKNEALADLDPLTRLLFIGLWTLADRRGRLEDRPKRIKAEVLPYDDYDAERGLSDLAKSGFIVRYKVDQSAYIQIVTFEKHQHVNMRESDSTIPAPCQHRADTVPARQEQEQELLLEDVEDTRDFENEIEKAISALEAEKEKKPPLGRAAAPLPPVADLAAQNPAIRNTYLVSRRLPPERFEEMVAAFDTESELNQKSYTSEAAKAEHFLNWAANRIRIEQEEKQRPLRPPARPPKSTITRAGSDPEHYRKPQAF